MAGEGKFALDVNSVYVRVDGGVVTLLDYLAGQTGGEVTWADVTAKPTTFPPATHTHTTAQVTGLDTALAGKAPTSHTHTVANVTGLQAALDAKATAAALAALDARVAALETPAG